MCSCQLRTKTFFNFDKTKADSQADLSLSWAHRSVCFDVLWLNLILFVFLSSQVKEIDGRIFAATSVNIVKILSNCHCQEFMAGSSKGYATGF